MAPPSANPEPGSFGPPHDRSRPAILFIIRTLQFGGAERQLAMLARGLHGRGHRVAVMVLYAGGPLAGELERAEVPILDLGKRGRWHLAGPVLRSIRLARQFHPTILHGYLPSGNAMALLLRRFLPDARVVWAIRSTMLDFSRYNRFIRATYWIANRLARHVDLVISNSWAGLADHVAAGYPADRAVVIPNGIDLDRFTPAATQRGRTRASWGVAADAIVVGMVCRVDPMKDHPTFLRAMARLVAEEPQLRAVCIGNGPGAYRAELEALTHELGIGDRVRWLPAVVDVAGIYPALDVLCSASAFGEGFSNVLGEALASGVPCVATDVGDAARILGDVGRIVPPRNPEALALALREAIAARSPALSARCRARVADCFGTERLLDATERALGLKHA